MSSLAIRNMNYSIRMNELAEEAREKLSPIEPYEVDWFDWLVYRKAKRGNKEVTIVVLHQFTKREFADWWKKCAKPEYKARVLFNWNKARTNLVVKEVESVL